MKAFLFVFWRMHSYVIGYALCACTHTQAREEEEQEEGFIFLVFFGAVADTIDFVGEMKKQR